MKYAKAYIGATVAGLTSLQTALDGGITAKEWIGIILATLAGGGFVAIVPNRSKVAFPPNSGTGS